MFCGVSTVLLLISQFTFLIPNTVFLTMSLIMVAVFLIPIIPIGIAYANEVTFPLDETVVVGFILMCSYAWGFVLAIFVLDLTKINSANVVVGEKNTIGQECGITLLTVCALIATIVSMFLKYEKLALTEF